MGKSSVGPHSHAQRFAHQITLHEHSLFTSIDPSQLLGTRWKKEDKETRGTQYALKRPRSRIPTLLHPHHDSLTISPLAPMVLKMIDWFNTVTSWVTTEIIRYVYFRTHVLRSMESSLEQLRQLKNTPNDSVKVHSGCRGNPTIFFPVTLAHVHGHADLFLHSCSLASGVSNFTTTTLPWRFSEL